MTKHTQIDSPEIELPPGELEVLPPSAVESLMRGEIDVQIATAHKYPRSIALFKKRALEMVSLDEDTAASCIYTRPVGEEKGVMKYAEGMSVRMAEIVGACYGNLRVGSTIVDMTPRHVTARGYAHDLESNYASASEVVESTVNKKGQPYTERMRAVVAKAALAKARRDATFVVVPKALCKPLEERARQIAIGDATTLAKRRAAVMGWIRKLGIDIERAYAALGIKGAEDIGIDQLTTLTGLKTSIKDGEVTVDEAFPPVAEPAAVRRAAKPDWERIEAPTAEEELGQTRHSTISPTPEAQQTQAIPSAPPATTTTLAPAPPARRQRPAPAPRPAVTEPAGMTSAKDALYREIPGEASRANFLDGLKLIEYPGVPEGAEQLVDLPEETCAQIIADGANDLMTKIRDKRWADVEKEDVREPEPEKSPLD